MQRIQKYVAEKSLQAVLLLLVATMMWIWALQIAEGKAGGTGDEAAALFFIGFGALIFGSYRGRQAILASAEVGGIGKQFTKRNLGFGLILLWLALWYGAWKMYPPSMIAQQAGSGRPLQGAQLAAFNQAVFLGLAGFFSILIGYGFVNAGRSNYQLERERHGYS